MSKTLKSYRTRKWAYLFASIFLYFFPVILTTFIVLPPTVTEGTKMGMTLAVGLLVIAVNALPFVSGILQHLFSHVPMINTVAIIYAGVYSFLSLKFTASYGEKLFIISIVAVVASIISTVFFELFRLNAKKVVSAKTITEMGLLKVD